VGKNWQKWFFVLFFEKLFSNCFSGLGLKLFAG
jgi:hypothetical protein